MSRIVSRPAVTQCDSLPRFSPLGACRSLQRQRLWACLGGLFFSAGVLAQAAAPVTAQPYPSVEAAQQVADAAKADRQHALDAYQNELARCSHTFFVNHCGDMARKERDRASDAADLVRQRAELFIRQVKGRERQEKLAAENADRDARNAAKHPPGQDAAAPGGAATPSAPRQPAAPRPPHRPAAPPASRPVDDPAVRASNREIYERKQEDARAYAEQRAKQREQAEANRKQHREQREAEAAKLKNLNPPPPANPSTAN